MRAYVFPGQGSQFSGMGKELYENSTQAKELFEQANELLTFRITDTMFGGTDEELKQTKITQPAIFLHSVVLARVFERELNAQMVAGHSLGEISALTAAGAISFEDGLLLVYKRAMAMQKACEAVPSTMAAILGMEDAQVEAVCAETNGIVVVANYNCPGQLVISGAIDAVQRACELATSRGAKRALILPVGGAFHSPLMEPAKNELAAAIEKTQFHVPICPIYQNVNAKATSNPSEIKENLINQLTAPVRWTQTMEQMLQDGATEVVEVGPGKVLQGLFKKINRDLPVSSASIEASVG